MNVFIKLVFFCLQVRNDQMKNEKKELKKKRNSEDEVKEELIKSWCMKIVKEYEEHMKSKSEEWNGRVDNEKRCQDAIPIIQEYETILQRQKRNIKIALYRQGCVFQRQRWFFREGERLGISKSTVTFKINLVKFLNKFPKLQKSSLQKNS